MGPDSTRQHVTGYDQIRLDMTRLSMAKLSEIWDLSLIVACMRLDEK